MERERDDNEEEIIINHSVGAHCAALEGGKRPARVIVREGGEVRHTKDGQHTNWVCAQQTCGWAH